MSNNNQFKLPAEKLIRPSRSLSPVHKHFAECDDSFMNHIVIENLTECQQNNNNDQSNSSTGSTFDNSENQLNQAHIFETEQLMTSPPPAPPSVINKLKRKSCGILSPQLLNAAAGIKRKSVAIEEIHNECHNMSEWFNDKQFFQSQFFKQNQIDEVFAVDGGDDGIFNADSSRLSKSMNMLVGGNLSQFFQGSQLNKTQIHAADHSMTEKSFNKKTNCINTMNLTQIFSDIIDDEDIEINDNQLVEFGAVNIIDADYQPEQSSQRFLSDIKTASIPLLTENIPQIDNDASIIYESRTAAAYIEKQRSLLDENDLNLIDDEFLIDQELSQAYKSTQYRKELDEVFVECQRSICIGVEQLVDDNDDGIDSQQNKPVAPLNQQHSVEEIEFINSVTDMDWSTEGFGVKTPTKNSIKSSKIIPLVTPTSIVRQRLGEQRKPLPPPQIQPQPNRPIKSVQTFKSVGPFFGLPWKVKNIIRDFKGITDLYDWQKECLSLPAIIKRNNLIYALPTSGGKTLVSEILILREIICNRKNCLFILPYVSIVQEKLWALSPFAVQLDFLLEEYAAGKGMLPPRKRRNKRSIYVATIEKGLALLDSLIETDRANELGLVVVDELHIVGESGRGATLESLLTKILFINAGIQIVGMSATIGNLNELAKFLNADVYTRDFRPVELTEYIKCGSDILKIDTKTKSYEAHEAFKFIRTVDFKYRDDVAVCDPDHLAGLVSEVIPLNSCLIFCPSKQNCENVAILLSQMLPAKYLEYKKDQRASLAKFLESSSAPLCPILSKTLPYGIAYHHSGLTAEERRHLEDAYRQNILLVICCTSTLAAGVNLPAKRVILRSPYVGREFLTLSRYKQMVGRAGRAGMCDGSPGESILICSPKDNLRITKLLCSPMDEVASCMTENSLSGLKSLILSAIGLKLATNRMELEKIISITLMSVQAERLTVNPALLIEQILTNLFKLKALSIIMAEKSSELESNSSQSNIEINKTLDISLNESSPCTSKQSVTKTNDSTARRIRLKPSTQLSISKLGKASFKSGFDLAKAKLIYQDLIQAQQSLVLTNHLHLLYIVTPCEPIDLNIYPDMSIYYAQYLKLDKEHLRAARTIGLTESTAMKLAAGKTFKFDLARIVGRFFLTLILNELWQQKTIHEVAHLFHVNRGIVQNLVTVSASYASGIIKFCEELDEFWAFQELLRVFVKRLSYCCTIELIPLMELPCVKLARAKQLYSAGYRKLETIAKANVKDLVDSIEHLNTRVAKQLISSAKVLLLEKVETLREEVQDCLEVLEGGSSNLTE